MRKVSTLEKTMSTLAKRLDEQVSKCYLPALGAALDASAGLRARGLPPSEGARQESENFTRSYTLSEAHRLRPHGEL